MELGAIVVVPESPCTFQSVSREASCPLPLWPVAGKNLIQDWSDKVRRIGASIVAVTPGGDGSTASRKFQAAWNLAKQGVEQLLVISVKSYAEIDLVDFVKFHRDAQNPASEACDHEGSLGVELLSSKTLNPSNIFSGSNSPNGNNAVRYSFNGYAKRLHSVKLYRDLVSDALRGRCALTPSGLQTGDRVWIGQNTRIAPSVRFLGPCFVGDGTVLRDFVSIGPYATVENRCRVESGTTISGSSVMPNTFLSAGLNIRRSIVDGSRLEHLDSGIIVDLSSSALGGRIPAKAQVVEDYQASPLSFRGAAGSGGAARLVDA